MEKKKSKDSKSKHVALYVERGDMEEFKIYCDERCKSPSRLVNLYIKSLIEQGRQEKEKTYS